MKKWITLVGSLGIGVLLSGGCMAQVPPGEQSDPTAPAPKVTLSDIEAEIDVVPSSSGDANHSGSALPIVTLDEDRHGAQGRLIDPITLTDLPGYAPIDFGDHFTYARSPDGQTLALITWPSDRHNRGGVLHLVDLSSWTDHRTDVAFDDYVSQLGFSPDGEQLYWAEPRGREGMYDVPRNYELARYDLNRREVTAVAKLPTSFVPGEMRMLRDGSRLAVYGVSTDRDNLSAGAPRVFLVDPETGRRAADIRLDGVTAGHVQMQSTAGGDISSPHVYRPGVAWDQERDRLYVVHADADALTVVDLAQGEVREQASIRPRQSWLQRLWDWLVPTAEAKMLPGTEKQAVLSPDGRRLYVAGLRSGIERPENQGRTWREVPLGVQAIAIDDLTEVGRLDLPANHLALSPDGRWLLLTGVWAKSRECAAHGLYLLDTQRLDVVGHLQPESEVYLRGFSPDGRYAYVSTATFNCLGNRWDEWRVTLLALDLETGRFVAEREFDGYFLDVIRRCDSVKVRTTGLQEARTC